jgi:hypothetical protein
VKATINEIYDRTIETTQKWHKERKKPKDSQQICVSGIMKTDKGWEEKKFEEIVKIFQN